MAWRTYFDSDGDGELDFKDTYLIGVLRGIEVGDVSGHWVRALPVHYCYKLNSLLIIVITISKCCLLTFPIVLVAGLAFVLKLRYALTMIVAREAYKPQTLNSFPPRSSVRALPASAGGCRARFRHHTVRFAEAHQSQPNFVLV